MPSVSEVQEIGVYDLAFLGFPMHQFGPDKRTKEFLERNCTAGRKIALFVTHAAQEDYPELPEWLAKFNQAASGAEVIGFFNCQGGLAKGVKFVMTVAPIKKPQSMAKRDDSKGQPDSTRLGRAREFARTIMARFEAHCEVAAGQRCTD